MQNNPSLHDQRLTVQILAIPFKRDEVNTFRVVERAAGAHGRSFLTKVKSSGNHWSMLEEISQETDRAKFRTSDPSEHLRGRGDPLDVHHDTG